MKSQSGFTLIELVLVIMIMGVISVVVGRVLFQSFQTMRTTNQVSSTGWQGLIALNRMASDIHTIRSAADISTVASGQLAFTDVNGNAVQYQLSGANLQRNGVTLASGVQSLSFGYQDKNGSTTSVAQNVRYITMTVTLASDSFSLSMSTLVGTRGMI